MISTDFISTLVQIAHRVVGVRREPLKLTTVTVNGHQSGHDGVKPFPVQSSLDVQLWYHTSWWQITWNQLFFVCIFMKWLNNVGHMSCESDCSMNFARHFLIFMKLIIYSEIGWNKCQNIHLVPHPFVHKFDVSSWMKRFKKCLMFNSSINNYNVIKIDQSERIIHGELHTGSDTGVWINILH